MMNASAQPLIRLEGLTKVFYTDEVETHALAGIHLELRRGEYVAIAGPSGCGKSTLLSLLGLLDSPTEGGYWLNEKPVAELSLAERTRIRNQEIGFIFQNFNLIGDLSVFENVELPLTYRGMAAAERRERVGEALDKVGMGHRAKHLPSQLSGGQQQRVAVARALVGRPLILLAERTRIRNQEIGFIFQNFNLIGDLSVFENVELPLTYRGMAAAERRERLGEALDKVGMGHRAKHLPSQLSGGQQQRVAVARALVGRPLILLADEPTGNLDSKNGEAVMELLRELHQDGATVCMVTHDTRYAKHAERAIHLFDGRIVEETKAGEAVGVG